MSEPRDRAGVAVDAEPAGRPGDPGRPGQQRPPAGRRTRLLQWMLGVLAPVGLAGLFVARYGVDVPAHDEWNFVPALAASWAGEPWTELAVEHYGEHRIVLPKTILLLLAPITGFDTKLMMFLSVGLLGLTAAMLARLVLSSSIVPGWLVVPVGWLVVSTAQYENLLVGWQFQIPLLNFFAVAAVLLLARSQGLAGAIACGFAATFSFANGLAIWLAALPLVLARDRRWRSLLIWGGAAGVAALLYGLGYRGFDRVPDGYLRSALPHPGPRVSLLLAMMGNHFGDGTVRGNVVAGVVVTATLLAAALAVHRRDRWRREDLPWIALLAYSLLSAAAVALGRSFSWQAFATPSRFLTLTVFIPVCGLWLIARASGSAQSTAHAASKQRVLRAVMVAGLLIAAYAAMDTARLGWQIAAADRAMKLEARECVREYRTASVECLARLYAPGGELVRQRAAFLEETGMSPFNRSAERAGPAATPEIIGTLDFAGNRGGAAGVGVEGKPVWVEGWGLASGETPASILVAADGVWVAATADFFARPDVERALAGRTPRAGWRLELPANLLEPGAHRIEAFVLARGSSRPVPIAPSVDLEIVAAESEEAGAPQDREVSPTAGPQEAVSR